MTLQKIPGKGSQGTASGLFTKWALGFLTVWRTSSVPSHQLSLATAPASLLNTLQGGAECLQTSQNGCGSAFAWNLQTSI